MTDIVKILIDSNILNHSAKYFLNIEGLAKVLKC